MLTHIQLQHFAIVDRLALDFDSGFCVLTGETGAGKSIWVDAISMALGQRADTGVIRNGHEKCDITLSFDISNNNAAKLWLKENDLDAEECIIRRVIAKNGPAKSTINGVPFPLQRVKALADLLIHVHSQHQQQALLQPDKQRIALDRFASTTALVKSIQKIYQQWKHIHDELEGLKQKSQNHAQEIDFLKYQMNELIQLGLQQNEWEQLTKEHQQLQNAKSLITQLNQAIELTVEDEETSAQQLIQQALSQLDTIQFDDEQLKGIRELLNTAAIHLQEAGSELQSYRSHLDLSPENLADVETRISAIYEIARKHHCDPDALFDVQQSLQSKLDDCLSYDDKLAAFEHHEKELLEKYHDIAKRLTTKRQKAAKALGTSITTAIRNLDITDGEVQILLNPVHMISPTGNERIEFSIKTNAGGQFQPLQKIASGGELSRICLALQVMTATKDQTPTLIFDEVDVGISGKTAAEVGKQLRQLGDRTQVLCITHLPQVAANGHQHYKVSKKSDGKQTQSHIAKLDNTGRQQEIARLLSGVEITKQTLAHANELLSVADV